MLFLNTHTHTHTHTHILDEWRSSYMFLWSTSWFGRNFQILVLILVEKWLDWHLSASWFSPWFLTSCYRNNRWSKLNILGVKLRLLVLFKACNILSLLDPQYEVSSYDGCISSLKWYRRPLCLNFLPLLLMFCYHSRTTTWNRSPALGNRVLLTVLYALI